VGGALNLTATANSRADADTSNINIGLISVAVVRPAVSLQGATRAAVDAGAQIQATGLSLVATASNTATASLDALNIGLGSITTGRPAATSAQVASSSIEDNVILGTALAPLGFVTLRASDTHRVTSTAGLLSGGLVSALAAEADATVTVDVDVHLGNVTRSPPEP